MGVGADDEARAAIEEMPIACFSRSPRRGMSTTMASACSPSGQAAKSRSTRAERIIERVHEDAAHRVDDEHAGAVPGRERGAATRRAGGILIGRRSVGARLDEDQGSRWSKA